MRMIFTAILIIPAHVDSPSFCNHLQPFLPKTPYIGSFFLIYKADSVIFFLRKSNVLSLISEQEKAHRK